MCFITIIPLQFLICLFLALLLIAYFAFGLGGLMVFIVLAILLVGL